MAIWFTSDLHLGHSLVAGLRGYADADEHSDVLAGAWDLCVRESDQVWVLGDLTLGNPEPALDWIDSRPGTKHLIAGNHDRVHPLHRTSHREINKHAWLGTFDTIQTMARRRIGGIDVLLSHFPYPGTSEGTDEAGRPFDDRYLQYRLPNLGMPIMHGHTHRAEKLSRNDGVLQIHVGVDAWDLRPVNLGEVADLLMKPGGTE